MKSPLTYFLSNNNNRKNLKIKINNNSNLNKILTKMMMKILITIRNFNKNSSILIGKIQKIKNYY